MAEDETRIGKLPPRYKFILNPYDDLRSSKCPICDRPTHTRKLALFIVVDGAETMVLGKTCRFCTQCGLIVVHKDELEHELVVAFERRAPHAIGNEYVVVGTMDKKMWRKSLKGEGLPDPLARLADFEEVLDLHYEPGGWRPA